MVFPNCASVDFSDREIINRNSHVHKTFSDSNIQAPALRYMMLTITQLIEIEKKINNKIKHTLLTRDNFIQGKYLHIQVTMPQVTH